MVLSLALFGVGPSHALSLRSSAAESFLGDASPGQAVVYSRAKGGPLRVENSGTEPVRVEFSVVVPPKDATKDGWEPWTQPVRVEKSGRAWLKTGEAAEAELTTTIPKSGALVGGQYEYDVVATGYDRAGASLKLKTRVLLSVGAPLPKADAPAGGFAERPGFTLTPAKAGPEKARWAGSEAGEGTTVKLVNAGDEDLTVTLSPVREWDENAQILPGYEPAANPRWLRFEPEVVKIRAGAIGRARVWASVPKQARYAGRRWAFVAAVDAEADGRRTRRYFVLHADAERLEEETRKR